jgi:hypothetical protein
LVEDKDEDGLVIGDPRPALDWGDYFLSTPNELGVTSGDHVLSEFWVSNMFFAICLQIFHNLLTVFRCLIYRN